MSFPTDRNDSGITSVAQFAGRLWYAGATSKVIDGDDRSPNIGTFVFFTQVIDSKDKFDKCYQEADPTSETISDLVDTDGGYVALSGARRIFKLVPLQNSLVVFADNGVWQILGGDTGFSATGYQVTKVTEVTADSRASIVVAESVIFFWAKGGIYILAPNDITPALRAQNITEGSIQSFYTAISKPGRKNARGAYDPVSREVKWLYNDSDTYNGVDHRFVYNKELVFNTVLSAFTVNTLSTNVNLNTNEGVSAYFIADDEVQVAATYNVVVGGDQVVVGSDDVIVNSQVSQRRASSATKYLVQYDTATARNIGFALQNNTEFSDWGNEDAKATLVTGYESFGDTQRRKRLDTLTLHCLRTETGYELDGNGEIQYLNPSSVQVTFYWDWDERLDDYPNDPVQGYRLPRQYIPTGVGDSFDYPKQVISTKLAPKGTGRAMSMKLESEEGKDMYILGWGYAGSGNGRP